jgi:hypothetical protein
MGLYPYNYKIGQAIATDVPNVAADMVFLAHFQVDAAFATVAAAAGIHAAVVDNGAQQVVTTAFTQPSVPRNITATVGGVATDIKGIQITITGTNYKDEVISEVLPAFTLDTVGTVVGNKAFKTITSITIPAHDGVGATTAIGFGEKLGLPYLLPHNTVREAYRNNVKEGTAPAVTTSITAIEDNTIDLNSALNSTIVDVYLMV